MKKQTSPKEKQEEKKPEDARYEALEHQLKRALADYQNLDKRSKEEKREWIRSASKGLLLRLLPVLDTLIMASQHSADGNLKVALLQFQEVLALEGVALIKTEGKEFNPATMECIVTEEVNPSAGSGQLEGKVTGELRPGYMLYESVLRPAQVKVGKKIATNY